jgi:hypothetical protein
MRPGTRDHRAFVEDHGGILHEDRIGKLRLFGKLDDFAAERGQGALVFAVLAARPLDIDRRSRYMRQLAPAEIC